MVKAGADKCCTGSASYSVKACPCMFTEELSVVYILLLTVVLY